MSNVINMFGNGNNKKTSIDIKKVRIGNPRDITGYRGKFVECKILHVEDNGFGVNILVQPLEKEDWIYSAVHYKHRNEAGTVVGEFIWATTGTEIRPNDKESLEKGAKKLCFEKFKAQ